MGTGIKQVSNRFGVSRFWGHGYCNCEIMVIELLWPSIFFDFFFGDRYQISYQIGIN